VEKEIKQTMDESMHIVMSKLQEALETLRSAKPDDRSEIARRYAVTITEMEKVIAYYATFIEKA